MSTKTQDIVMIQHEETLFEDTTTEQQGDFTCGRVESAFLIACLRRTGILRKDGLVLLAEIGVGHVEELRCARRC
jgi:hypothetical protein